MEAKITRRMFTGLLTGMAGLAVFGSLPEKAWAQGPSGNILVGWWGDNSRAEATNKAAELFQAAHPGVSVKTESVGFQAYMQKLTTQLAGGGAPDLFQLSNANAKSLAENDVLLDLAPYTASGELDLSSYDRNYVELGKVNGKLVTLPVGLGAGMVIVDVTKLGALGIAIPDGSWGWDQFAELSLEISKKSPAGYWGTADGGGNKQVLETLVRQRGKFLFSPEGQLAFDKSDLGDHFEYWNKLRTNGAAVKPAEQAVFQDQLDGLPVIRGIAAFDFSVSSILFGLTTLTKSQITATLLPIQSPTNTGQGPYDGQFWSVGKPSGNPGTAVDFLNFMISDQGAIKALAYNRGISPSSHVREIVNGMLTPQQRHDFGVDFFNLVSKNPAAPKPMDPPGANQLLPLLRKVNEDIGFGRSTVSQGVDAFFAQSVRALR